MLSAMFFFLADRLEADPLEWIVIVALSIMFIITMEHEGDE